MNKPHLFSLSLVLCLLHFVSGCSCLTPATPGDGAVSVQLPGQKKQKEWGHCGYVAAVQVLQYYTPGGCDRVFERDAFAFDVFDDTASIFMFLKENLPAAVVPKIRQGTMDLIYEEVSCGDPVMIFVPSDAFQKMKIGVLGERILHCIIVSGYDLQEGTVFFYSDGEGPYAMTKTDLDKQWTRTGKLCIIFDS